jgi:PIN domain nuclease of toxin-antitoxin system
MKALLDTHVLIWALLDESLLTDAAVSVMADTQNELLVSVMTGWEIGMLSAKGRLRTRSAPRELISTHAARFGTTTLVVNMEHAIRATELPRYHGDPVDRMLVAQAQVEGIPIISADSVIRRYPVDVIW